ncbi:MAG: DUF4143 domain-containing protein [Acidimicrobiia bacterium]
MGRTGQLLNDSALAGDVGVSQPTAKAWLRVLEPTYVTFRIPRSTPTSASGWSSSPSSASSAAASPVGSRASARPPSSRPIPYGEAVFERWVASGIFEYRRNAGESVGLSHDRDRHGAEMDLVVDRLDGLVLVEVEAATTIRSSLCSSAVRVAGELSDQPGPDRRRVRRRGAPAPQAGDAAAVDPHR